MIIVKYYYKSILSNSKLSIDKRIKLWKIILNVKEMNFNYKEMCKDFEEIEEYKVIMDDTKRTSLANKDKEKTQEVVKNILCCFISKNNYNIRYCQGMNFIVQFLHEKFGEEEAFYIFLSFFKNTDYRLIFEKRVKK